MRTLGWAVYYWAMDNLVHGITGDPLELNNETLQFWLSWYELDDNGGFVRDRGAMRRARGTGKSPMAGNLADC